MHVGVWFWLLRSLLDAALEQSWGTTGGPSRFGITVWRPDEIFAIERQEAVLETAAAALGLIRIGTIIARGSLGPTS